MFYEKVWCDNWRTDIPLCSTWDSGLLFVGSADFKSPVDKCEFWNELLAAIKTNNYRLGNGHLMIAEDIDQLDPCRLNHKWNRFQLECTIQPLLLRSVFLNCRILRCSLHSMNLLGSLAKFQLAIRALVYDLKRSNFQWVQHYRSVL